MLKQSDLARVRVLGADQKKSGLWERDCLFLVCCYLIGVFVRLQIIIFRFLLFEGCFVHHLDDDLVCWVIAPFDL